MKYTNNIKTILIVLLVILNPISTIAHPGNTASDGCHYCRTNCDKWGEAWNERHCHGGYTAPSNTNFAPTNYTSPVVSKPLIAEPVFTPNDFISDNSNKKEEDYTWLWILTIIGVIGYFKMKE